MNVLSRLWRVCAAGLLIAVASPLAVAGSALTLHEATQRTLQQHPQLQVFKWQLSAAEAQQKTAALAPGFEITVEGENLFGSGNFTGTDQAEYTIALGSVIELGGKRDDRQSQSLAQYQLIEAQRDAEALDLLGSVTQAFIETLALQAQYALAKDTTALAKQNLALVQKRVDQAAAAEAEKLRAKAALAMAGIEETAALSALSSQKQALAAYWNADTPDFDSVSGNLFVFDTTADFPTLFARASASPAIAVFASEARLREADLQLAKSQSRPDLQWQIGVRQFSESSDTALAAGVTVPLFSGQRNSGKIQASAATLEIVRYQQAAATQALRVRLFAAWQQHQQAVNSVGQMQAKVLPALREALQQTQQGYVNGRYSYLDWMGAQQELLRARQTMINAARAALLNQAVIEQLTAEPIALSSSANITYSASQKP